MGQTHTGQTHTEQTQAEQSVTYLVGRMSEGDS